MRALLMVLVAAETIAARPSTRGLRVRAGRATATKLHLRNLTLRSFTAKGHRVLGETGDVTTIDAHEVWVPTMLTRSLLGKLVAPDVVTKLSSNQDACLCK
jgi:hypothetical protein